MGALEFKQKMAQQPEAAWQDYLRLCRLGGSKGYLDPLRTAGLSNHFEAGAVARATACAREILRKGCEQCKR